ncbi:BTA121 domain-containing protein surface lipoprotein, partial [Borrelia persica]|uniref:BTA121 domain-containing protein surface lipoprotein n=1 Tax=Borrelia persica TaxID=44448 RepID=UPI0012682C17
MQYVDHKDQKNNYSKRLEMLKRDVSGFTSLADRYSGLPGRGRGYYVKEIRSIITDYNIAREQGYKTYSNDEFDILLSSWDVEQVKSIIDVYLSYASILDYFSKDLYYIDDVQGFKSKLGLGYRDILNRLKMGLILLEGEVKAQFGEIARAYPVQFKGFFNKHSAAAIYESIISIYSSSIFQTCFDNYSRDVMKFFDVMSNFVASYDVLDIKKQMTIEWIRDIIFDPKIVVFP